MAKITPTTAYAVLSGLADADLETAEQVVAMVEAEPHLYLTNGQACRGYDALRAALAHAYGE